MLLVRVVVLLLSLRRLKRRVGSDHGRLDALGRLTCQLERLLEKHLWEVVHAH